MKNKLLITTAATLLFSPLAHAQSEYDYSRSKGDANILQDTQKIETSKSDEETTDNENTDKYPTDNSNDVDTQSMPNSSPYADFTGFYGGGDIGYTIGSFDVNDPTGPDGDVGLDGLNGDVFLGYGFEHSFSWLGGYAGLEVAYEWSGADGDLGSNSYEKNHAILATLRPGITMHQDTLGYGIIGYSRAKFEGNGDDENLDGLILGAGAEFDTNTALKARIEYTFTQYEDADLGGVDFEGHENNIKVGALFRF